MRVFVAFILLSMAITAQAQFSQAGGLLSTDQPEFLPVEEAYILAVDVESDHRLRLYWQIADNYYLYQHRFAFELSSDDQPLALTPELPPALERIDEYFGEVRVYYNDADISLQSAVPPGLARLAVTSQGCADAGLCYPPRKQFFEIDFTTGVVTEVTRQPRPNSSTSTTQTPSQPDSDSTNGLLYMLLLAFLGGSILNLMPCVFPILSLKVLSFASSGDHDRHLHGWVYSIGVVVSFVAVAALLIGLQQAGRAIGWGFQLQSPGFVIALAYLFIAMGLALNGVIEMGSNLMNTGSSLADSGGLRGSFFTGVLAVVVASPCTAPMMGTAVGFAATQSAPIALLVFFALGAGMAAPLLLLSYSNGLRKMMPAPGPWMETLKQLLAFPLYATAIWLLWVAGRQTGVDTMAVALCGALALALAMWLWGGATGPWRKGTAVFCIILAISLASWRGAQSAQAGGHELSPGQVAWSEQTLANLRAQGTPVFVDVTADWCITCIANEQAVLYTDTMKAAFAEHGVAYMVADWTNYDADIAAFLAKHDRNGIPLYLAYPADPTANPIILPQLLTSDTVMTAIESISAKKP